MGSRREMLSIFGEALLGEANVFHSVLPSAHGATDSANSLALQVGGDIDVGLSRHFAFRVLQAEWLRTRYRTAQPTYRTICSSEADWCSDSELRNAIASSKTTACVKASNSLLSLRWAPCPWRSFGR
jgi:hypothetical protein